MKQCRLVSLIVLCIVFTLMVVVVSSHSPVSARGAAPQKPTGNFAYPVTYGLIRDGSDAVAIADLNGDGKLDLAVANEFSDTVSVLLGNGNGTFETPVSYSSGGTQPLAIAIADVNGDKIPDLIVTNVTPGTGDPTYSEVSVLLGNGNGTFQTAVGYSSGGYFNYSVAIADLNGDGHPDLVVANYCPSFNSCANGVVGVLLGKGDGTFQPTVSLNSGGGAAAAVAVADIDGDGHVDIVVANDDGTVAVLAGNGNGTFQSPVSHASGADTYSMAVGDLNGDGYPDLVLGGLQGLTVLLGGSGGQFSTPVGYGAGGESAHGVTIADINGDGYPDIVVAECSATSCSSFGEMGLLLGNGDGTFQAAATFSSGGSFGLGVAVADLNADGKPDVVIAGGNVGVLLNNISPTKSTVVLTSSPNPSQAGQEVTFTATVGSNRAVPNGSTVTFTHGKALLGRGTTTKGVASLTTSFSAATTYAIKATYAGDAFHDGSSGVVKQVVQH